MREGRVAAKPQFCEACEVIKRYVRERGVVAKV